MLLPSKTFLTLVCVLGYAFASSLNPHRKTLEFGPVHSHAKFHTVSTRPSSELDLNPYQVARNFVTALVEDRPSGYNTFSLRKDSYTDKTTGVTHVFYRQLIRGIQVLDGNVNVNVKNGAVISYGDSVSIVVVGLPGGMAARWRLLLHPVLPWRSAPH